jgi:hypothetical protein
MNRERAAQIVRRVIGIDSPARGDRIGSGWARLCCRGREARLGCERCGRVAVYESRVGGGETGLACPVILDALFTVMISLAGVTDSPPPTYATL